MSQAHAFAAACSLRDERELGIELGAARIEHRGERAGAAAIGGERRVAALRGERQQLVPMRCACARADSHSASIACTSALRIRRVSSRIARAASSSCSFAACSRSCRVPGDHGRSIENISETMFEYGEPRTA